MKTDIEIARSVQMRKITEIAQSLGIPEESIEQYGHYMAKVPLTLIDEEKMAKSKLILVTAITATKAGIKPIFGCEVYMARRGIEDRVHGIDNDPYHLVLLCENRTGYENLCLLVSEAFINGFYGKPRVDLDMLRAHHEGLIALSACLAGAIPQYLMEEDYASAREYALKMADIFGPGNFYLELQDHGIDEQRPVNQGVMRLARENGLPLVVTNDAHYLRKEDARMQDILLCVQTGKTVDEPNRMKFETEEFYYENGIRQYLEEIVGDDAFTMPVYWEAERRGRDAANRPEMKLKITASFCFSKKVSRTEYYHNSSWLEYGGSPDKAVRSAFTAAFDKFLKDNNKYTKNESKVTVQDVLDSLVIITNCFSTIGCFENQTKKSVNSKFTQDAMTAFFKEQLQVWFLENRQEAEKAAEQILVNKRARESAEKTKSSVKKKLSGTVDIANRVQKFVDCRSKDTDLRELYIVEGDSALGSVKMSRDAEFQGIMPIRGKILNCLKADYNRIFASPIITDLMKVLGCGVEIQGKKMKELSSFDLDNLRWSKVIICTDADYDGFQIRTLVLTMLYRLCPTLIQEGYVYIAESPLFEITCKDKTWFAYNEAEKTEILRKLEGKKVKIQRSKGLGENDPEMMWMTTMNPDTRRLIKVMPEDAERTAWYFDVLLGDELAQRKDFIAENGAKYLELADIS